MIFESITKIVIADGPISIDQDGYIVGATTAKQDGNVLIIGEDTSNITACRVFSGFGTSSSITSSGTILQGPRSTRIKINGCSTTYGQIMDWCNGAPEVRREITPTYYYLGKTCSISTIECVGSANLDRIFPTWLSKRLTVIITGSGDVHLPKTALDNLIVSISGSGQVIADEAETDLINVNIAGSGSVNGVHVLNSGSVSIAGSGDVNITAREKNSITRSIAGSGHVHVRTLGKRARTS